MNNMYYILDGHNIVPIDDVIRWSQWLDCGIDARRVAETLIGDAYISTVFLGINHSFGVGKPLLFETMVFQTGGPFDQEQERCSTWEQAEVMHATMVARVKGGS